MSLMSKNFGYVWNEFKAGLPYRAECKLLQFSILCEFPELSHFQARSSAKFRFGSLIIFKAEGFKHDSA